MILKLASGFAALTLLALSAGCSTLDRTDVSSSAQRKAALTSCVSRFLREDVAPVDSLHICSSIYSRWEPTTTRGLTNGLDARSAGAGN